MSSYLTHDFIGSGAHHPRGSWLRRSLFSLAQIFLVPGMDAGKPVQAGVLMKRAMDIALSFFGLIASSPLMLLIGAAVWLESPGSILYTSLRAGMKGRIFVCYKFRTMIVNADKHKEHLRLRNERHGPFFKMAKDPRITRFGRLLRCYSLDELPQLWNVLRGEMSLVGPRPHPLDDIRLYQPEDLRRLEITPGLTGLWQVTARCDPSFRRNVALDLEYIAHRTFWMDVAILYKTIFAVLGGTGA
jgi:lipopolysaccharide/colanic/teichoic acid biosynthesis glycosyltransferase